MAAADALALYLEALESTGQLSEPCDARVLCEWHEDWVLLDGDHAELVSGKHRDPSVTAFTTLNKLAGEGGLAHLFERWLATGQAPLCRLVTTGGLAAGEPQELEQVCAKLRQARLAGTKTLLETEQAALLDRFAKSIEAHNSAVKEHWSPSGGESPTEPQRRQELAGFLSVLSIDHGRPQRAYIQHAAPSMFAQPVLDRIGVAVPASVIWEAVVRLFRSRMRSRGPVPTADLPRVLTQRAQDPSRNPDVLERDLLARIVTMQDIDYAIKTALRTPQGYMPVVRVPRTSRVAVKMAIGGCSDNAIERAEDLRIEYQDHRRDRLNGDVNARAQQRELARQLLRIVDEETPPVDFDGATLWRRLQNRVDDLAPTMMPSGMDSNLALGGICSLSNECKVWFSARFDVEAEVARLRAERRRSE